ncbi:hypothetical protein [Sphingobium nicotianae]|uniref:Metallothionein n=1 Tax=Sphingobium nicotianae TaxID=2782607 RepID=A0A9X1D9Q1_9SPHN|nr:hypothetical protein [Sphingobium nicotianae]MBT2185957.1 hypothetical protein [Sphingobium nicotianae]
MTIYTINDQNRSAGCACIVCTCEACACALAATEKCGRPDCTCGPDCRCNRRD